MKTSKQVKPTVSNLFLLSTEGCHLCEQAFALCQEQGIQPNLLDIIEDELLVERYADKIPVLIIEGAEQALFWPFTPTQIEEYLTAYGIS